MAPRNIKVKPGKTESLFGFIVGLIFVGIGVFFVIPTFGAFGIFWTVMAGGIVFMNFLNAFSKKGVPTHEIIIEGDEEEPLLADNTNDIEAKLLKLYSLYEKGLITEEEYDEKRKAILEEF